MLLVAVYIVPYQKLVDLLALKMQFSYEDMNKSNNKITELRAILQRESQNS